MKRSNTMNMRQSVGVLAAVVVLLTCPGCDSGVDDRSATLEARISELESTVRNLSVYRLKSKTDDLESQIDGVDGLKSRIEDLETQIDDLEYEIAYVKSRVGNLESISRRPPVIDPRP